MLVSCFALWGLLNNMTDNLVPAFSKIFMINASESAGVQISFYGSYAVLAIFASILLSEFSYRTGLLIGLGFYMVGALCYIPAAIGQSFDIYLMAIFVLAGGLSILETTCNPFVLSMGSQETSVRRLNFAQAFNPIGSLAGIFLAKYFILANLNDADMDARKAMDPETLNAIVSDELFWVCVPYVGLVAIAAIIWSFFCRYRAEPPAPVPAAGTAEPAGTEKVSAAATRPLGVKLARLGLCIVLIVALLLFQVFSEIEFTMVQRILVMMIGPIAFLLIVPDYRAQLVKLIRLPRYICGVAAQFFYVGVQITVWTWTIKYAMAVFPGMQEAEASTYYLFSIILFIFARAGATALMKIFNPAKMMTIFAVAGILCCLGTMYLPSAVSIWTLVAISGCMSLMFPTIYGLALRGLGEEVKLGAAGLIMAILGGAIITPFMGACIDDKTVENQGAYFASIERPLVAEAELADKKNSLTGAMLTLYKMSETDASLGEEQAKAAAKFETNLAMFASLPSLDGAEFAEAAKTLPGCANLGDGQIAQFKANLALLPGVPAEATAEQARAVQIRNFTLVPALSTLGEAQADVLKDLIENPLNMQEFKGKQTEIVESAVRTSFFIPIISFIVVLLYGFAFRNSQRKDEEAAKKAAEDSAVPAGTNA